MDKANSTRTGDSIFIAALRRRWRLLSTRPVPEYQPGAPTLDPQAQRLRELERMLDLLEQTKIRVAERGWCTGGWFTVSAAMLGPGATRLADPTQQRALLRRPSNAGSACLIGSMLLLADDQDSAHTITDVWRATDELYEAMHERAGHTSLPAGHRYGVVDRHHHLRALTSWNDEPGRTQGDVVDLLNRGISRTITACVA